MSSHTIELTDKQMLISVTTNFIHIFVVTLLSRLQYIHYQAVKFWVWQRDDVTTENQTIGRGEEGAVRHHWCRRVVPLSIHGFTLQASPAVTHGASPLGTVDAYREALFPQSSPPTGSPLKHPHRGRWVSATKYNKGAGWRNKDVSWQPYCVWKRYKGIHATAYRTKTLDMKKLHQNSFGGAIYRLVSFPL